MLDKSLVQMYAQHAGKVSDKWASYLPVYERLFQEYRDRPISMLEIGVQNGGSLEVWADYFPKAGCLIGCDINPDCAELEYEDPRVSIIVGDATTVEIKKRVLRKSQAFDVVIDDGSHLSSDIVKSFALYFPNITDGGVFIAEDLHCAYWMEFGGGMSAPFSCITFFKHLADIVNYQHWGVERERRDIFRGFFAEYGIELDEATLSQVHSIEFINSICVVRKAQESANTLGRRFIAGHEESVISGHFDLSEEDASCAAPSQLFNPWSSRDLSPYEELPIRLQELVESNNQLAVVLDSSSWRWTRPLRTLKIFFQKIKKSLSAK